MSERDIKYYKQLAKQFSVKTKLFDQKEDYNELEGAKANYQKKQAEANVSLQEQMLKVNKLKNEGNADKALKLEAKAKKKEADIAKIKHTISEIQKKIDKKKQDVRKVEDELTKLENQLKSDFADKFTQM